MLGMSGPGIVGSSGLSATRTAGHELRLFGIAGSDELRAIEESSRPRNGRVESNAEIVFVNCLLAIERIAHGHTLFSAYGQLPSLHARYSTNLSTR